MTKTIEQIPPDQLRPYERNSRTHSPEQVQQIVASIAEFGFVNPVLIDDGRRIIAGHGRVLAAASMGLETVPCLKVSDLTEAQIRAYIIADNKLAENSGWDEVLLRQEMGELHGLGFDLSLTGFSAADLESLLNPNGTTGNTDPDEVPDTPDEPTTRMGDIWAMGDHRLMCGDSTSSVDVARLLRGGGATSHGN